MDSKVEGWKMTKDMAEFAKRYRTVARLKKMFEARAVQKMQSLQITQKNLRELAGIQQKMLEQAPVNDDGGLPGMEVLK